MNINGPGFSILGTGLAHPARRISSEDVDERCGKPPGWTKENFGLDTRHWAGEGETSSSLGADAAGAALADAGIDPFSLDVIIGACGVMEQPIPGTAALIQQRLGLGSSGIPAFDINATCLSFLTALDTALLGFAAGRWRRALIVAADIASAGLDFTTPEASAIFGDGAAAVVLEGGGSHRQLAYRFSTFGDHAALCRLDAGGTRVRLGADHEAFARQATFKMDGPAVFKATAREFPEFLTRLMADAGAGLDAIDLVIPHQASDAALRHLRRSLPSVPHEHFIDIFAGHGNQMAVSLPHALHVARQRGRLGKGTTSLLIGSAAGLSLGGMVIRW